jgi:hypothetical protein
MRRIPEHVHVDAGDLAHFRWIGKASASATWPDVQDWWPICTMRLSPAFLYAARMRLAWSTVKAMVFSW